MAPPAGFAIGTGGNDEMPDDVDPFTPLPTATLLQAAAESISSSLPASAVPSATGMANVNLGPPGGGECELLGSFALVVQAVLGGLALLSLVYKRWRERPQRPLKIWFFDVSKQVFGAALVHIVNVFMSMLTSGRFSVEVEPSSSTNARRWLMARDDEEYTPNPCSFYLLNLAIDTTIGIPILIGLLKLFTIIASYTPFGKPYESIQSGNYGNPPSAWWWFKQSVIYFIGLFGMKMIVLIVFVVFPWISRVGDWALGWTEGNEQLQIFFVMMFFPLIMNALQYYVIDSLIKKSDNDHERLPEEDPDWAVGNAGASPYDDGAAGLFSSDDEDSETSSERGSLRMHQPKQKQKKSKVAEQTEEYDPELDGDAPTVVGSSTSGHGVPRTKSVPQELYPKE